MGLWLIKFDGEMGILRCNHVEKENIIKLLRSIRNVSSRKVEIETVGTSGTIKSLVSKYMNK
jgi:RNase P/RNase MRP subunit POP5